MDSTGPVTLPETPIYDDVVIAQGWSPEDLRPPLDVEAMIAASYGPAVAGSAGQVR